MSILFVLIPLGLVLVGFAAWAFFWAVNHGQFDDLDTPAISILTEDEPGSRDRQDHSSSTGTTPATSPEPVDGLVSCDTEDVGTDTVSGTRSPRRARQTSGPV